MSGIEIRVGVAVSEDGDYFAATDADAKDHGARDAVECAHCWMLEAGKEPVKWLWLSTTIDPPKRDVPVIDADVDTVT